MSIVRVNVTRTNFKPDEYRVNQQQEKESKISSSPQSSSDNDDKADYLIAAFKYGTREHFDLLKRFNDKNKLDYQAEYFSRNWKKEIITKGRVEKREPKDGNKFTNFRKNHDPKPVQVRKNEREKLVSLSENHSKTREAFPNKITNKNQLLNVRFMEICGDSSNTKKIQNSATRIETKVSRTPYFLRMNGSGNAYHADYYSLKHDKIKK